ncbi:MAG: response regulator [Gemmatimonadaceae bacterium]|nr:response regulator [Gemmatimonadaceae bacterium]
MTARILLVEDSALISGALRVLLEASGYDVTVAATASEAIAWPDGSPPDVMLLDLTLPDGDGLTVIGGLAARGLRPRATLAMTGHGDTATRERCASAGCDAVLVKPVPVKELLQIVSDRVV